MGIPTPSCINTSCLSQSQLAPALRHPLSVAVYWGSPQQRSPDARSSLRPLYVWCGLIHPHRESCPLSYDPNLRTKSISCISKRKPIIRCRAYIFLPAETQEARKLPLNNGYTSKVRVHDRYEVVGFISSGTYGKVYKAVGVKGQSGEFAIKKCVQFHIPIA